MFSKYLESIGETQASVQDFGYMLQIPSHPELGARPMWTPTHLHIALKLLEKTLVEDGSMDSYPRPVALLHWSHCPFGTPPEADFNIPSEEALSETEEEDDIEEQETNEEMVDEQETYDEHDEPPVDLVPSATEERKIPCLTCLVYALAGQSDGRCFDEKDSKIHSYERCNTEGSCNQMSVMLAHAPLFILLIRTLQSSCRARSSLLFPGLCPEAGG
jgi:hypothetical protein